MPGINSGSEALELGLNNARVAVLIMYSKIIGIVFSGVSFILVARFLGAQGYGIYVIALGFAGLASAFGSTSIESYFGRYIPIWSVRKKAARIKVAVGDGVALAVVFGLLVLVLGGAVAFVLAPLLLHGTYENGGFILGFALLGAIFSIMLSIFSSVLISVGKGVHAAVGSSASTTTQAILAVALVYMGFGPFGAVLGYVVGFLLGGIYTMLMVRRHAGIELEPRGIFKRQRDMLRFSLPLAGANVINTSMGNFAVVFLALLFAPAVVGVYGVATKMSHIIGLLANSIGMVMVPMLSYAGAGKFAKRRMDKMYKYTVFFMLLFTTPIIGYLLALSGAFTVTLFTSVYPFEAENISMISVGMLLGFVGIIASYATISRGKVYPVLKYSLISAAVTMAGLLVFAAYFGSLGAIFAVYYLGNIVYLYLILRYNSRALGLHQSYSRIGKLLAANIAVFVLIYASGMLIHANEIMLVFGVVEVILAYPIALAAFGVLKNEDLSLLKGLAARIAFAGWLLGIAVRYYLFLGGMINGEKEL